MLLRSRQNPFFSATMPSQIGQLAGVCFQSCQVWSPGGGTQELVEQSVYDREKPQAPAWQNCLMIPFQTHIGLYASAGRIVLRAILNLAKSVRAVM
ncbi:hypothetical protein [Thalassospira alkalitolerans]|uniref:hypothetical protein n=1 Tax=Thalassospira alkalitolerans TaxID=1293890 RepID=UPI003AA7EB2B